MFLPSCFRDLLSLSEVAILIEVWLAGALEDTHGFARPQVPQEMLQNNSSFRTTAAKDVKHSQEPSTCHSHRQAWFEHFEK